MFLQAHKQRMKLQMFQRLWRILVMAIIAIAAFFVVSSMSLSNRLDESELNRCASTTSELTCRLRAQQLAIPLDSAGRLLGIDLPCRLLSRGLDLATCELLSALSPYEADDQTANNRSFSMSQELAQDEAEADAEDYALVPSDVTPFRSYAECLHGEGGRQMEAAPEYQAVRELVDEEGRTLPYAQPSESKYIHTLDSR